MRFLISQRRHRAARPIILAVALLLMGALYASLSPTRVAADGTNAEKVAAGKNLFAQNCASCHGLNGEGGSQAPTLIGVGAAAVDFQVGTGRMPMAQPGAQALRKPPVLDPDEIAALAAYVESLGPGQPIPPQSQYSPEGLTEHEIARGGELFRTNCSACHNFGGGGGALPNGKFAPPLHGVEARHIWEALRTGPQQMPVFSAGAIPDQDVRAIIAYLKDLEKTPSAGFTLGGLGPVTEGLAAWIFGIVTLVLFALWIAAKGARAR